MNRYTSNINLNDLAFLGVIFIGLTFALLLGFTRKINKAANRFLALAVFVMVLWIVRRLSSDIRFGSYYLQPDHLPLGFSLAFGPLLYFYVLKLTQPDRKLSRKGSLHFVPVLLQQVVLIFAIKLNWVLPVLAFFSVASYLYLSQRAVGRFYRQIQFIHGDRYRTGLRWLHRLLTGFGWCWVLWIPLSAFDYFYYHGQLGTGPYNLLYLVCAALTIRMAAAAYLRPEAGFAADATPVFKQPLPADLKQKGVWLKKTVKEKRYYEDPELNLRSLAEKLALHPNELSRIINTSLRKSFNDFINEYRVGEAARKMQDPAYDHITLQGIAFESGFNSKTTFHRIFKEMTGKSPAEYKTDLKKELPSYNLEPRARFAPLISYPETTPKWTEKKSNRKIMVKNYFKTAWRSLLRNKSYATINIAGLAIGIAACLLIFLIVQFETSFDKFHAKRNQIYRVITVFHTPDGVFPSSGSPIPLSTGLRVDFPQLKVVSDILQNGGSHYSVGSSGQGTGIKKFKEDEAYFADPQFFETFDFKWLAGDKKAALAEPNTVVLSRDEANKFFGDWQQAIGKIVKYENSKDLKVTGIIENTPANTDFPIRLVVSWLTATSKGGDVYGNINDWVSVYGDHNTYIVLPSNMSVSQFNKALVAFVKKHKPAQYTKDGLQLQSLADMHYNTKVSVFSGHPFSKELIDVISLIGLFLLIIACVNFINLATAQAVNRSKEVGIRKVLGSNRKQLVMQFISETLIITLFAVVLAVGLAEVVLPMLNSLLEIRLSTGFIIEPALLLFLLCVTFSVTLLSGFYPALVLSGFNPIEALRNRIKAGRSSGISLRRVLVVAQFCIAQVLVIGTLVLIYQMNYFNSKSLGFTKDAVITVPFPGDSISRTRINALKDQLLQQPGIKDVSFSFASPSDNNGWGSDFKYNNAPKPTDFNAQLKWADPEYFKLYNLQFVAGSPYNKTDTISGYVVNEVLMNKLGVHNPKDIIGKYIKLWDDNKKYARVTGVVKDFNIGSLRNPIPPVLMAPWKDVYQKINIKIQPFNVSQTLASVERLWNNTFPDGIYEYQFLDDKIANFYKSENELSTLYKIFAGIAIFISCLGLYGLVSFMAVQRTKEVGIRKTLGASVGHIVYLFSKEFTVLIGVAFLVAGPLGYYFMHKWLLDFTYRITIGPDIFILAILASVVIAWISVGYRAVKAALANPVKSLRSE
ncbi:MAG: ABC transporter permease [Bacteroidetes bacterium]|nr:ABC transporter permease [Bacteroidota bacterium]